jgi:hypothetical protein
VMDVLPTTQTLSGNYVTFNNITITGGSVQADTDAAGGGVRVLDGRGMQLVESVVRGNDGSGGTYGLGGGVANQEGFVAVLASVIISNTSDNAAGLANFNGITTISNSTISHNTARGSVGGIINLADNTDGFTSTLLMDSVTIAYNVETEPNGSGAGLDTTIFQATAFTSLQNVIVSNNTGEFQCFTSDSVRSNGYNLASDDSCEFFETTDLPSTDPLLGTLTQGSYVNGGITFYHPLSNGSPALDTGDTSTTVDQRFISRPIDLPEIPNTATGKDRGSIEMSAPVPTAVTVVSMTIINPAPHFPLLVGSGLLIIGVALYRRWRYR